MLAGEQLAARLALLLRPHCDDLGLRVHPRAHDLRPLPGRVNVVACGSHARRDVLVLLRDRVQIVDAVERVLEGARLDDHLDQRRIVRLVDVDHPQVELVQRPRVGALQKGETLRLELVERVELVRRVELGGFLHLHLTPDVLLAA